MTFTTTEAVKAAIAQHSGDPILALLTIEHPSFGARREKGRGLAERTRTPQTRESERNNSVSAAA